MKQRAGSRFNDSWNTARVFDLPTIGVLCLSFIAIVALILFIASHLYGFALPSLSSLSSVSVARTTNEAGATAAGTIMLKAGGDLQAAINRARPGDVITLEPRATFVGNFTLPTKGASEDFIVIRSAAPDAQLPHSEERLDPRTHGKLLPVIRSGVKGKAAITATGGAHHYGFFAIEFAASPDGGGNIISLGTTEEKSVNELPHHIEFDRCYIHGDARTGARRGIALNGRDASIRNSYFADFKRLGDESQAIAGWNGTGPFEIINNYIEAAAEGVIFGGADSPLRVVASDIVVRGNHFNKPLEWMNQQCVVKNHFELNSARRVVIDGYLMTKNCVMGQDGTAVLFTTRDEEGTNKQATIADVLFVNNHIRGSANAFNIYGSEGAGGHRLTIRNNLFEDIGGAQWKGRGLFMKVTDWQTLVIENNTILTTANIAAAHGKPITNFVFRNNIVPYNEYGFFGDALGSSLAALEVFFPNALITNNAFIGGGEQYTNRNLHPATLNEVKFVNPAQGDYRLRSDSPLRKLNVNGKPIGADLKQPASANL